MDGDIYTENFFIWKKRSLNYIRALMGIFS